LVMPRCMLAEADLLAGRAETARLHLTAYLQPAPPAHAASDEVSAQTLLAWVEGEMGQVKQAEERLAACLAAAKPLYRVDALRVWGLLATLQGYWAVAVEALDEALASARAMPYPYAEAKTLWAYGRLEAARRNPAAARERFTRALAICDRLGEGWYRRYIERDLRRLPR
jgi:tetratricopeptide (TPR) repeat protein